MFGKNEKVSDCKFIFGKVTEFLFYLSQLLRNYFSFSNAIQSKAWEIRTVYIIGFHSLVDASFSSSNLGWEMKMKEKLQLYNLGIGLHFLVIYGVLRPWGHSILLFNFSFPKSERSIEMKEKLWERDQGIVQSDYNGLSTDSFCWELNSKPDR